MKPLGSNEVHSDAAAEAFLLYNPQALQSDMVGRFFIRTGSFGAVSCDCIYRLADMLAVVRKDVATQAVLSGARQEKARVYNEQSCSL